MRDVLAKMRECGKDVKMRDFPHDCGMVDTYANHNRENVITMQNWEKSGVGYWLYFVYFCPCLLHIRYRMRSTLSVASRQYQI